MTSEVTFIQEFKCINEIFNLYAHIMHKIFKSLIIIIQSEIIFEFISLLMDQGCRCFYKYHSSKLLINMHYKYTNMYIKNNLLGQPLYNIERDRLITTNLSLLSLFIALYFNAILRKSVLYNDEIHNITTQYNFSSHFEDKMLSKLSYISYDCNVSYFDIHHHNYICI